MSHRYLTLAHQHFITGMIHPQTVVISQRAIVSYLFKPQRSCTIIGAGHPDRSRRWVSACYLGLTAGRPPNLIAAFDRHVEVPIKLRTNWFSVRCFCARIYYIFNDVFGHVLQLLNCGRSLCTPIHELETETEDIEWAT
jgi:hypothetical protein